MSLVMLKPKFLESISHFFEDFLIIRHVEFACFMFIHKHIIIGQDL